MRWVDWLISSSRCASTLKAERFRLERHGYAGVQVLRGILRRADFEISIFKSSALKRASITDFRWHDLRHTWASWLIQNGTPLYDLQEMGGWKSAAMVRRYAHLAPAQMARHAAVVDGLLRGTSTAQQEEEGTVAGTKKGVTITRNALI
jgi:integrase